LISTNRARTVAAAVFTGIVREVGTVAAAAPGRLRIEADTAARLKPGDSLAINGTCLTAVSVEGRVAAFDVVPETLSRTNLGALRAGDRVNLEPPLAAGEPIGGHFVQGHVDGTATVESLERVGDGAAMKLRTAPDLARRMIPKGSIALDGVSLTIVEAGPDAFSVALIPHTLARTTLGARAPGDRVNVELDILGKYVERILAVKQAEGSVDRELLQRAGFT
jgi:riboflavin synthase